jgi:SpoVK/Ycf46/Vps4 family AAA+-type ATPase
VGKTLTAEALAEIAQRPLFRVNLGIVSAAENWERYLEYVFDCAHAWRAILLIDEAEVVLEERAVQGRKQNAWVSVFLRKVEYYQGTLILTTNLINIVDQAFRSRVRIAIEFGGLDWGNRKKIWDMFISGMSPELADLDELLACTADWASKDKLNARQIRNIVLTAESLVVGRGHGGKVTPADIEVILRNTLTFADPQPGNKNKVFREGTRWSRGV